MTTVIFWLSRILNAFFAWLDRIIKKPGQGQKIHPASPSHPLQNVQQSAKKPETRSSPPVAPTQKEVQERPTVKLGKPSRRGQKSAGWNGGSLDDDPTFSPIFGHDPRDHEGGFEKCPHGVPKIKVCAICDPEKFRFETGIE